MFTSFSISVRLGLYGPLGIYGSQRMQNVYVIT